jgi:hypothetical protein
MSSSYAKKMAELSARIFGQIIFPKKNTPNARLVQRFAQKPIYKLNEFSMDYCKLLILFTSHINTLYRIFYKINN